MKNIPLLDGDDGTSTINTVEVYDSINDEISLSTSLSGIVAPVTEAPIVFAQNKIWIFGGRTNDNDAGINLIQVSDEIATDIQTESPLTNAPTNIPTITPTSSPIFTPTDSPSITPTDEPTNFMITTTFAFNSTEEIISKTSETSGVISKNIWILIGISAGLCLLLTIMLIILVRGCHNMTKETKHQINHSIKDSNYSTESSNKSVLNHPTMIQINSNSMVQVSNEGHNETSPLPPVTPNPEINVTNTNDTNSDDDLYTTANPTTPRTPMGEDTNHIIGNTPGYNASNSINNNELYHESYVPTNK